MKLYRLMGLMAWFLTQSFEEVLMMDSKPLPICRCCLSIRNVLSQLRFSRSRDHGSRALATLVAMTFIFLSLDPSLSLANACREIFSARHSVFKSGDRMARFIRASLGSENQSLELAESPMIPRGSALMTISGHLKETGFVAIIHAATGSFYGLPPHYTRR